MSKKKFFHYTSMDISIYNTLNLQSSESLIAAWIYENEFLMYRDFFFSSFYASLLSENIFIHPN